MLAQRDLQTGNLRVRDSLGGSCGEQDRRGDGDESRTATHDPPFSGAAGFPAPP
jgi:hypothetical protein